MLKSIINKENYNLECSVTIDVRQNIKKEE